MRTYHFRLNCVSTRLPNFPLCTTPFALNALRYTLCAKRFALNALPKLFLQYFYGQPHHLLHYLHIDVRQLFNIDTTLAHGKLA